MKETKVVSVRVPEVVWRAIDAHATLHMAKSGLSLKKARAQVLRRALWRGLEALLHD